MYITEKAPMHLSAILLLGLLLPATVQAGLPPAFSATYTVSKAGLTLGNVKISLRYDNGRYLYQKETVSKGLLALFRKDIITEISEGRMDDDELTMDKYHYLHQNGRKSRENTIRLVAPNMVAEHYKGKDFRYKVPEHSLDRASVEIALMRDASSKAKILQYPVVEKGRVKPLEFVFLGETTKTTPAGKFGCIEYRVAHQSSKRSTTLCVAPSLDYLPVTVTHVEKGTSFTMHLKQYRIKPHGQR